MLLYFFFFHWDLFCFVGMLSGYNLYISNRKIYPRNSKQFLTIGPRQAIFGTYRLCEQRRFRRACASAQSRQNLRCSLIQAVIQEEPSDRKPDPWPP